ncbi:HAUS augmin-like complex subunit 2 isoform X1 [Macaca nemestrina]|uniref:HAUS augmin like complex subunit 2 n=6 Tax=Cercopithecinae TaxID=9528 RepID=A0A2K5KIB5_CERAT|nr:PREDICTED: HAUS augmin-like complex subunit 2 isoform X1 [Mandrillus leucophaeus]XP_011890330.1 PREDICTED: HAUS augmin-like complex subunit 2 isoform X1 [Cercocebus atys]XP_025246657.1 HAUS augmin-like complex subunit 2 isoform X1 [Theropithecus gelada]XP_050655529.1 HAUS augmin-like complex subunit 2 isoform X1 [Macaca thibetana thibetana]
MAAANPWDPASAPNGAGLVLGHLIASGMVNQEMLNMSKKTASCFVNFTRLQQITDIEAEIYQKNLEIELLKLEKDTADVVHPFFLAQKCHTLQSMNNHLEAVLKEKRSLRQRLLKPMCQENLPIEAVYHRYMVHLLELAVTFIERLETHLETIRNIPHLAANLKKMNQALAKMDILVTETEELAENILKWRKQQNEVSSCIPKILAEESYLYKHDITMPPLPFTSKVHVQTTNAK